MRRAVNQRVEHEHQQRVTAVRTVRASAKPARAKRAVAKGHGVTPRAVRRWDQRAREGRLWAKPPGPAPKTYNQVTRAGLLAFLLSAGVFANEHEVRRIFGTVTYSMIRSFKQRLRRVLARRKARGLSRLTWTRPGAAWAMDFTQPAAKLPEKNKYLLIVIDIASGMRLASVPSESESGAIVRKTLKSLFRAHGAPLVLKHDNGSAFVAKQTQTMLKNYGVTAIASPPYTPSYNGSVERSLGWFKVRAEHIADQEGHPGSWSQDNIEEALRAANETPSGRLAKRRSPAEAFERRTRITRDERRAFKETIDAKVQADLLASRDEFGTIAPDVSFETLESRAVVYALHELGYLRTRRGRLSTLLSRTSPDRNS